MASRTRRIGMLAGAVALGAIGWYVVAFAYPRVHDLRPIPALTVRSELRGLDSTALDSVLVRRAELFLSRPSNVGIVIGVVVGGRRHVVARGRTDTRPDARAVDGNTLFKLASVSKTFAGILLAQAALRGEVALDQRVETLLPASYASPELTKRRITLLQLATHSSGLPQAPPGLPIWSALWPPKEKTEAELATSLTEALREHAHAPPPFSYSSFGFMLLGRTLERAGGRPYARLLREDIWAPLGMSGTGLESDEAVRARIAVGHTNGLRLPLTRRPPSQIPPAAAGVVSSANDMLTYLQANLHPERTSLGSALRLAATVHGPEKPGERLGLAWFIETDSLGRRRVYHHGAATGYWSFAGFSPEADVAVVVLANSRDPSVSALGLNLLSALCRGRRSR